MMKKKVLFVASECTPFAKTGGLADVIGSLPPVLNQLDDIETRVILPLYRSILTNWRKQLVKVTSFDVSVGWRKQPTSLYIMRFDQVTYYFIENEYYFSRDDVYGYEDDGERFVYFCEAVISSLPYMNFQPNIIHAHDWQASLSLLFNKVYSNTPKMKSVLTIHNLKYQGIMLRESYHDLFRLDDEHIAGMEWHGLLNCLKAGIYHADKITTVSPTYAEEIKTPYYGEGLFKCLQDRSKDLSGILNGIDTKSYHPKTDQSIRFKYQYSSSRKRLNKLYIQHKFQMEIDPDKPMYVMITRFVEQKGLHLIERILDQFLSEEDVQFIVLGTGEYHFEHFFYQMEQQHKGKMIAYLQFNEKLARQLYAAGDFFVMPSKFEPCGLAQLIALQYNAVPIVRETGGLKDTIVPYNEYTHAGNGFSFSHYNAHDLLAVLRYSLTIFKDQDKWYPLFRNVTKSSFSWELSRDQYVKIYDQILGVGPSNVRSDKTWQV
ncbi:glycogen synthase (ADP-glucose) [Gracilibacillus ureilyticus]|uniref:Glycogen synthase n=1 Tax=Gracilibacillus ureilyticus TaxID=531814 RepID=A0A1H9LIT4_9BACI|nr:glycogen synthase [Gracilibacillus ureilyticus]SER11326.1 glycogen synthase (ADP-glucose) [Gracilibacillus ureilyticus]